jgi:hypothetical protein
MWNTEVYRGDTKRHREIIHLPLSFSLCSSVFLCAPLCSILWANHRAVGAPIQAVQAGTAC